MWQNTPPKFQLRYEFADVVLPPFPSDRIIPPNQEISLTIVKEDQMLRRQPGMGWLRHSRERKINQTGVDAVVAVVVDYAVVVD